MSDITLKDIERNLEQQTKTFQTKQAELKSKNVIKVR